MTKILVVDDDSDLLEMVTLVLTLNGMKVECIDRGMKLQSALEANIPDVLLMDIYLGDSDGRDLCRQLKNSEAYREMPVILYSARHITEASIKDSNADSFVHKPFDIKSLISLVQEKSKK